MTRPATGFRCPRCADCCRVVRVPLTDADLRRLALATALPSAELIDWLAPDDIDMTGEPETFVALRPGRRLMVLAHRGGACRFLVDERCSVHAARPATCVAYPFHLEPCSGDAPPQLERLPGAPCEPESTPELAELIRASAEVRAELTAYAERVVRWNRQQRLRTHLRRLPLDAARFLTWLGP